MKSSQTRTSQSLLDAVLALARVLDEEALARRVDIDAVQPKHRSSALNLAHYLGLRKHDVRALQLELAAIGLSSLGRCEGHVRDTVDKLCTWLSGAGPVAISPPHRDYPDSVAAEHLLHANARALFGPKPKDRHVYIMVTAPSSVDASTEWADSLLEAGTNVLRINAAHESRADWERVVAIFKERAAVLKVPVRVVVDLPGPKLRTEIRQLEPGVIHIPRRKDKLGRTLGPSRVQLVADCTGEGQLPVPPGWLAELQLGDALLLTSPSGRDVSLTVCEVGAGGVTAECQHSLYITTGLRLVWRRGPAQRASGAVGPIPDVPRRVALSPGDRFLVNTSGLPDDPLQNAVALPEPGLLAAVQVGERAILDDGRIVAVVEAKPAGGLLCRVTGTVKPAVRLRSGKGIAFPDSDLTVQSLGEEDEAALAFAIEQADAVEVSFVNSASDVARVGERIRQAGRPGFGMILKIETQAALRSLPSILFGALKYDPVGLMIARGDLAIDVGFGRLAEMQEELLWFGEACHLPVIWATQVLDSVAHSGLPTRAEMTDAAMSMRAECVMLNKGPYVATANRLLADIIRKMEAHQYKKRALFRPLSVAGPKATVAD
jgi:pyruvate kinase